MFSRPLIESAIVATYLLREGDEAVEDFRRCSYKDTLRILRDHESGAELFRTPGGQRVLRSALDGLALEGLSKQNFAVQKRNRWRLQGKSLYDIFGEVAGPAEYPFVYGIMSESIHGSWTESMDWCLSRNDDGTFSTFALYHGADARAILPLVRYATPRMFFGATKSSYRMTQYARRSIVSKTTAARSTLSSTNSTTARPLMVPRPPIRVRRRRSP